MGTSASEASEDRIDVLRRKIAALESLASNPGTTPAESEAAQSTANKMRLELAKLMREGATLRESAGSSPFASDATPFEPKWSSAKGAGARPSDGRADYDDGDDAPSEDAESAVISSGGTRPPMPAWTWLVPSVGIVAVAGAYFWLEHRGQAAPQLSAASPVEASMEAPRAYMADPAAAKRESGAAVLAHIAKTRGSAAAAEAARACRMRDVVKEFQATSGAALRSGESDVDVRRRCGAYLTVRGLDDAVCFPPTADNAHPTCPIPE